MPIVRRRVNSKASAWLFSCSSTTQPLNLLPRIQEALIAKDGLECSIIADDLSGDRDIVEAVHKFFQSSRKNMTRLLLENASGQDPARLSGILSTELSLELKIEALVAVVSPSVFLSNICQGKSKGLKEGDRTVAEVAIDEVEFADVLLLLTTEDPLLQESERSCRELLSKLNPGAKLIELPSSLPPTFDLTTICVKALFGLDTTAEKAGWSRALEAATLPQPSSEASSSQQAESPRHSASCFTFRSRRPFHPQRLRHLLHSHLLLQSTSSESAGNTGSYGQIVRSRGIAWMAGPHSQHCSEWHQAGPSFHIESMGPWFKFIPRELWLEPSESQTRDEAMAEIEKDFVDGSDERNELVFIGVGIDEAALSDALTSCLCTDEEMEAHHLIDETLDVEGSEPWPRIEVLIEEMTEQRRLQAANESLEVDEEEEEEVEEEEEEGRLDVVPEAEEEGGGEDEGSNHRLVSWQPGKVYEVTLGAPEAQELVNQGEAALSSLTPPLPLTIVIDWHATWAVACKKDVPRLEALAQKHPRIVFMRIRIPADERGPNAALAREKVMDRPFSRRQCNRPIPRTGGKWPVYTIHQGPTLHPEATTSKGDGQPWMDNQGSRVDEADNLPLSRIVGWLTLKAPRLPQDDEALDLIKAALKPSSVPVPPPRAPAAPVVSHATNAEATSSAESGVTTQTKGSGSMSRAIPKGWWSGHGGSKKGIIASRSGEASNKGKPGQEGDEDQEGEGEDAVDGEGMALSADERAMLKKLGLVRALKRGAIDFKAHLHSHAAEASGAEEHKAGDNKKVLLVAWVPSAYKDSEKLARELDAIALEVWSSSLDPSAPPPDSASHLDASPIVLVADVGASSANTLLAKALLKQDDPESFLTASGPIFYLYSGMKLSKVVKGGLGSIHQLHRAVRQLVFKDGGVGGQQSREGIKEDGISTWSQPSSAFIIKLAPPGSPYEPPQGKEAVAGSQRSFVAKGHKAPGGGGGSGQVVGLYWPKMPCLSCGCPWWQGEDWDAKCVRCGWDCETDGYDDDSRPLPEYRARFEAFCSAIKQGRVAEHHM